MGFAEKR